MTFPAGEGRQPILPPVYFLGALLVMIGLHRWLPVRRVLEWPATLAGILLILLGMGLIGWPGRFFVRHDTTIRPFEESTALIQEGPYRFSRNPIYLGMVLTLVGVALGFGTLTPWAVVPIFGVLIQWRFIRFEERMLEATFGDTFRHYARRVRRWI